jgi:hypothetical protein
MNNLRGTLTKACLFLLLAVEMGGQAADRFASSDFTARDFFPILHWDPLHGWEGKSCECETNGLKSMAECNFNMAGFVLAVDLPMCRKLGLGAIVLPPPEAGAPLKFQSQWKELTDEEIDRRIRAMVRYAGSSPAVKGYFIMDEPGASDFPALGKAVAAVKKYAPGKLAYINLFPDYATAGAPNLSQLGTSNYTEYLERFVAEVHPQMLSYDNYQVEYSADLKRSEVAASYFRNLAEVRRVGQRHHLPCVQIVAANQLGPEHTIPTPANLALQAYTTLGAGFRGITWYTYYDRGYHYASIDVEGRKSPTWGYLSEVNRQVATLAPIMSRLVSTGIYFSAPSPSEGLPLLPGKILEVVACSTPLMVGELNDPRVGDYAMAVNLSLAQTARLEIKTKVAGQTVRRISAMDGLPHKFDPDKERIWLPAGQGVLLKIGG